MICLISISLLAFAFTVTAVVSPASDVLLFADRQITAEDVTGIFRQANTISSGCPRTIRHSLAAMEGIIPHSSISMNGRLCNDSKSMRVFTGSTAATRVKAAVMSRGPGGDAVTAIKTLIEDFVAANLKVIYGVEKEGRKCLGNANQFTEGTVVILFKPENDSIVGSAKYPTGRRYMIVDDPNVVGDCIYTAQLRTSTPSPKPKVTKSAPTPSSSPKARRSRRPMKSVGPSITESLSPSPLFDMSSDPEVSPEASGELLEEMNGKNPSSSPTPSQSNTENDNDNDDGSACFPGHATVQLMDGSVKKISEVQIGDHVQVGNGIYSDVFMFTHKEAKTKHSFIRISTQSGYSLTSTKGHYIYINGQVATAMTAVVGDVLDLGNGNRTVINEVSSISSVGLFNPQTVHGDIVVNSIRASTFTRTIEPATAQTMLAPFRILYNVFGWTPAFLDNGADWVSAILPKGELVF